MAGFLYLLYFHFQPRNVKVKSAKLKKKMIFVGYIHEFDAFVISHGKYSGKVWGYS